MANTKVVLASNGKPTTIRVVKISTWSEMEEAYFPTHRVSAHTHVPTKSNAVKVHFIRSQTDTVLCEARRIGMLATMLLENGIDVKEIRPVQSIEEKKKSANIIPFHGRGRQYHP